MCDRIWRWLREDDGISSYVMVNRLRGEGLIQTLQRGGDSYLNKYKKASPWERWKAVKHRDIGTPREVWAW